MCQKSGCRGQQWERREKNLQNPKTSTTNLDSVHYILKFKLIYFNQMGCFIPLKVLYHCIGFTHRTNVTVVPKKKIKKINKIKAL